MAPNFNKRTSKVSEIIWKQCCFIRNADDTQNIQLRLNDARKYGMKSITHLISGYFSYA